MSAEQRTLEEAIAELRKWSSGDATYWNDLHGSVTGDYANQWINTANADNAQKIALAAEVMGLAAIRQKEAAEDMHA